MMQLAPDQPGVFGPGLRKLRLTFLPDAACKADLAAWLAAQELPADDRHLLDTWWPAFKQQLTHKVQQLNAIAKQHAAGLSAGQQRAAAAAAVVCAHAAVERCTDAELPATLQRLMAARHQFAAMQADQEDWARTTRRQQWIHAGERPNPVMTRILRPPKAAGFIPGLRAPGSGRLVVQGLGMAVIVGRRYAEICATSVIQPAAQHQVLQAVAAHSPRLDSHTASTLGAAVITAAEVAHAISGLAPGKAPGLDGIPGELYRQFCTAFSPILARVYSAIGSTQRCPAGFLDGVVIPVLKPGGEPTDVDAYRPLQLLNYEYRILAKILANRLLCAGGSIIDPAQCAFLRGRHIGDSIRLLQVLPSWLKEEQRAAIAAFLDFRKAYDTISREFLFSVAAQLGVGQGFLAWMRVLLSNTFSCATVNGFSSPYYQCTAGVRQGCPLAPLLYLLVGQALLCHLKQGGVGLQVAGTQVTAAQYADDTEPFLPHDSAIVPFEHLMRMFGDASGQHVQHRKSYFLRIGHGASAQQPPPVDATIAVVETAKSLGIVFGSTTVVGVDWAARMQIVRSRLHTISKVPDLSAFGRAFATNAYALSTLLYGAQFTGTLPQQHGAQLQRWVSALVDANLSPEGSLQRPPGIPHACMEAHPRDGGFGLLPVRTHLWSRLAVEALQLLLPGYSAPWVHVARALVDKVMGAAPGGGVWQFALCDRPWLFPLGPDGVVQTLPAPVRSLALGLRALPPIIHVGEHTLAPGAWCWHAPLWSNPLATRTCVWDWFGQQRECAIGLEFVVAPGLKCLPRLRSVGQAVWLLHELERVDALPGGLHSRRIVYQREILGPWLQNQGQYGDRQLAIDHVRQLVAWLPADWVTAARVVLHDCLMHGQPLPVVDEPSLGWARARICADLGWRLDGGAVVRLSQLTVKLATRLQSQYDSTHAELSRKHGAYITRVNALDGQLSVAPPPGGRQLPPVRVVLRRWWKLKVANSYKETAWRLTLDAFPTAARMNITNAVCVACGHAVPDVAHHFWACPVAVVVRSEVEHQLVAFGMQPHGGKVACSDVWLGCVPHARVDRFVWDLVCLAAIHAMEIGRSAAWAVSAGGATSQDIVRTVATKAAVAAFWSALADFAATVKVPDRTRVRMVTQPFISWHVVVIRGSGLRVVRR